MNRYPTISALHAPLALVSNVTFAPPAQAAQTVGVAVDVAI
jgi:hypothetical protein